MTEYNQNLQRLLEMQEQKQQFVPTVKLHQEKQTPTTAETDIFSTANSLEAPVEQQQQGQERQQTLSDREILESIPKNS